MNEIVDLPKKYSSLLFLYFLLASSLVFAQPSNDNCSAAIQITPGYSCVATDGTLSGATVSTPTACTGTAKDVWYYFTATSTKHTVSVKPSSSFDAILQVFSGSSCASLTPSLVCKDAGAAGKEETVSLTALTIGQKYFYRIHEYWGATTGTFTTCVTMPPANDDCSNALNVPVDKC